MKSAETLEVMIQDMKETSDARHNDYKETNMKFMEALKTIETKIDATLSQALKTNGRVNKHDWYFKAAWWALGSL